MIDFPASPSVGQNFSAAGVTWTWDGAKWTATGLNNAYVPLTGGTMTGPLTLAGNPTAALQPATKQYVDGLTGRTGRNRLNNGAMRIDQRNAGAVMPVITTPLFAADRWKVTAGQTGKWQSHVGLNTGSNLAPVGGFLNLAVVAAYTPAAGEVNTLYQPVEYGNIADFMWGTSIGQPVTVSFWAIASIGGTYSGSLCNAGVRSYPFTFALSASVWTYVSITVPPDADSSWIQTSLTTLGMYVRFDLGCGATYRAPAGAWVSGNYIGANGAASFVTQASAGFNISNVQLELGSQASPFEALGFAADLAQCQRYYEKSYDYLTKPGAVVGVSGPGMVLMYTQFPGITPTGAGASGAIVNYKASKRALPTTTIYSPVTGAASKMADRINSVDVGVTGVYAGESMFNALGTMSAANTSVNLGFCWTSDADL